MHGSRSDVERAEIVLGIDNVVFISILVSRMDEKRGRAVRQVRLAARLGADDYADSALPG